MNRRNPCDFEGTFLADINGGLNVKHIPQGYREYVDIKGTIWIAIEEHRPKRDAYYKEIVELVKPIIKR